jgi:hypothetical protein
MLLTCGLPWVACAGVLSAVTDHRDGGPCSIFTTSPRGFCIFGSGWPSPDLDQSLVHQSSSPGARACLLSCPRAGRDIRAQQERAPVGTGAGRAHPPVPHGAPLVFAGASPRSRLLAAVQRPVQAWATSRARGAYLLGLADLEQRRPGVPDREEQLRIDVAARGLITPARAPVPGRAIREVPVHVVHRTTSVDVAGSDGWPHRCGARRPPV